MTSEQQLYVAADPPSLARAVATRAVDVLTAALAARPAAHLVITGGSILEQVLAAVAAAGEDGSLDWSRVHVWWGDERYVPSDSDERNDTPARRAFLDRLPLTPANVHPMPASDVGFGDDAEAAADAYAGALRAFAPDGADLPDLDLALIGIGPDGHCCSLFPDLPGPLVRDRTVIAVRDSPKPPPTRLSLTVPTLDAVEHLWFIASGTGKAEAAGQALDGADPAHVPSAAPRGRGETVWLLDEDAAARVPSTVARLSSS